jgi:hypothetical protein
MNVCRESGVFVGRVHELDGNLALRCFSGPVSGSCPIPRRLYVVSVIFKAPR